MAGLGDYLVRNPGKSTVPVGPEQPKKSNVLQNFQARPAADPNPGMGPVYSAGQTIANDGGQAAQKASGTYSPWATVNPPARTSKLMSANALSNLYGINIDENSIRKKFDRATAAEYDLKDKEFEQSELAFLNNVSATGNTSLDMIRKANAQAIATGASRGMLAANELSATLGLQDLSVENSTKLAQDRQNLGKAEAEAYSRNALEAMTTGNMLKQALGNMSSQNYATDTSFDVGKLEFAKALEQARIGASASMYDSDASKYSSIYQTDGNTYSNIAGENIRLAGVKYDTDGNILMNREDNAVDKYKWDTPSENAKLQAETDKINANNYKGANYANPTEATLGVKDAVVQGEGVNRTVAEVREDNYNNAYNAGDRLGYIAAYMAKNSKATQAEAEEAVAEDTGFQKILRSNQFGVNVVDIKSNKEIYEQNRVVEKIAEGINPGGDPIKQIKKGEAKVKGYTYDSTNNTIYKTLEVINSLTGFPIVYYEPA